MKHGADGFLIHSALILCLGLSACGGGNSGGTGGGQTPPTITSVQASCSPTSIQVNQTSQCTASVSGTGAFNSSVTWTASAGTIDQSGKYTAPGTPVSATITATSKQDSTKSGTTTITVNATPPTITSVSVSCSPTSIQVNQTSKCSATVAGTGNFDSSVMWLADFGSIDQSGNYTGPSGPATATITATSKQDSTKSGTTTVTVIPAAAVNWNGGPSPSFPITSECLAGDFNGDGKIDLACYLGNGASGPNAGVWEVALSTGSGWQSETWPSGPGPALPVTGQCFTGDFNGDGKTDLACYTGTAGDWNVALSTGSGWQSEAWNGATPPQEWSVTPVGGQCFTGDFNGDGKTDITCPASLATCGGSICTSSVWNTALSTGTGWNLESWNEGPTVAIPVTGQCFTGDFNGDKKTDVACWSGIGSGWGVALSTGNSWNGQGWQGGPIPPQEWYVTPVGGQCFAGDFDGDGQTDITCPASLATCGGSICTTPLWNTGLSTGTGWNLKVWNEVGGPWGGAIPVTGQCFTGDFNGDKKTDVACWTGDGGWWYVALSTGTAWNESDWLGGPIPLDEWYVMPVGGQCFTGDFNGDGITDVACYTGAGGVWSVALSSGKGW